MKLEGLLNNRQPRYSLDFEGIISGPKKLNNHNYITSKASIESYLQGKILWTVVGGLETTPPDVTIEEVTPLNAARDTKVKEKNAPTVEKSK